VVLDDDPQPVRAAACEATGPNTLRLTLTEGKYHQVKRMLAAVGNRCQGLHRSAIGRLALADGPASRLLRWGSAEVPGPTPLRPGTRQRRPGVGGRPPGSRAAHAVADHDRVVAGPPASPTAGQRTACIADRRARRLCGPWMVPAHIPVVVQRTCHVAQALIRSYSVAWARGCTW